MYILPKILAVIFWFVSGATKFFNRRRYRYYGNDNHVFIEKNGKLTEAGFFQLPFNMEVKFTKSGSNTLIFNMDNTSKPLRKFFSRICKIHLDGGSTVHMDLLAKHIRHDFRIEACDKSFIRLEKILPPLETYMLLQVATKEQELSSEKTVCSVKGSAFATRMGTP